MAATILPFQNNRPVIHPTAFVASGACIIGQVTLGQESSVWYNCVLRGDINRITIGNKTNIQDGSILHVDHDQACVIHDNVHVGHHVNLHGCVVEEGALIGIGSIVLSGARIGRQAWVAAGAVVPQGMVVPERTLVRGVPARVFRPITDEEVREQMFWLNHYVGLAKEHRVHAP